ncbi:DUF3618 domain-containing protein [Rubrivirga sp. S365]|uniref:DUF3618 domain-containing protein n=1 Tax=Rubrivirga sp. S365 TaxID=3076080 RepID=UPI0028C58649|nr:DUF3618 domain-containing protein [Rubrivirga sp. S365]MDT7857705.1 DUF3618 domain-containing protein [Rubrivirga sp. S365]
MDTTRTSSNPDAIAHDIRETRAEMDETIDALGAKLDPSNLADQAKEAISDSAKDYGSQLMDTVKDSSALDTIKENPIPAAAVGLSVAWLLSKMGESEADRHRHERYIATGDPYYAPRRRGYARYEEVETRGYTYNPYTGAPYARSGSGNGDESIIDKAKDAASDAVDTVKDKASDLTDSAKDRASDLASGAGDRTHRAGGQLQRYERRAESWLDRQMSQNPLAVGAVALAAGALVGLSIPETDFEDDLMGEQADSVKDRAGDAASGTIEKARNVATDVAEKAGAEARKVADDAKSKAKDVADDAKGKAKDVADDATSKAKSSASSATSKSKSTSSKTKKS